MSRIYMIVILFLLYSCNYITNKSDSTTIVEAMEADRLIIERITDDYYDGVMKRASQDSSMVNDSLFLSNLLRIKSIISNKKEYFKYLDNNNFTAIVQLDRKKLNSIFCLIDYNNSARDELIEVSKIDKPKTDDIILEKQLFKNRLERSINNAVKNEVELTLEIGRFKSGCLQ